MVSSLGQLYSAFASTAISAPVSHSIQTASHQTSTVINSSQQQVGSVFSDHMLFGYSCESDILPKQSGSENGAVRQNSLQNNNTSSNNVAASQHQLQGLHNLTSVTSGNNASSLDSHAIFTSITNNNLTTTSATINSITNPTSPTNSIVS